MTITPHNDAYVTSAGLSEATVEPHIADRNGYLILSRAECLDRLRGVALGRVAISMRALPVILPVRFALLDEDIVFRTAQGARLSSCCNHAVVAFEADAYDPHAGQGWSVCLTGMADQLTAPVDMLRVSELDLPDIGNSGGHYVRIRSDLVTGRQSPP